MLSGRRSSSIFQRSGRALHSYLKLWIMQRHSLLFALLQSHQRYELPFQGRITTTFIAHDEGNSLRSPRFQVPTTRKLTLSYRISSAAISRPRPALYIAAKEIEAGKALCVLLAQVCTTSLIRRRTNGYEAGLLDFLVSSCTFNR